MRIVAKHNPDSDGLCRACTDVENILHLCQCHIIVREYWDRVINLMVKLGMTAPNDKTSFIALGRLSDTEVVPNTLAGILVLAWRCLYAAITTSRIDNLPLKLEAAYKRIDR